MLTIIGALESELAGLRKSLRGPGPVRVNVQAIGVGRERAAAGLDRLLDAHLVDERAQPRLLLLGYAGGLDPALKTGGLVVPMCYYHESGDWIPADSRMWQQARVAASQSGLSVMQVNSLTLDRLAGTPEEKRRLYQEHQVGCVNMEDYWVAQSAARAGVPFLAVRAVLDPVHQELPGYVLELTGRPFGAAARWATRPGRWLTLWRLARMRKAAQASLTRFALSFIKQYSTGAKGGSIDFAE